MSNAERIVAVLRDDTGARVGLPELPVAIDALGLVLDEHAIDRVVGYVRKDAPTAPTERAGRLDVPATAGCLF